ncbi:hypothetical protein Franean1_0908 [Parafrankia sp. EAN1pec]|nr:hypothetical protein Franean1_0908 [Frankia sp. EAN1pec]
MRGLPAREDADKPAVAVEDLEATGLRGGATDAGVSASRGPTSVDLLPGRAAVAARERGSGRSRTVRARGARARITHHHDHPVRWFATRHDHRRARHPKQDTGHLVSDRGASAAHAFTMIVHPLFPSSVHLC